MSGMSVDAEGSLRRERRDGVLWLTKIDAASNYGVTLGVMAGLVEAVGQAERDPTVRGIVVDAAGAGFHNGASLLAERHPDLSAITQAQIRDVIRMGHEIGGAMAGLGKPVIGIARGGGLGGGLELLLRSDFLFCTDAARFSFPEVTLGLIASWGGTQLAARTLPFRKAQEFLLLGEPMDGRTAAQLGLVTRSFADADALYAHVDAVLARLRLCSPDSFRWTKACLAASWEDGLARGEAVELEGAAALNETGQFARVMPARRAGAMFDYVADRIVPP